MYATIAPCLDLRSASVMLKKLEIKMSKNGIGILAVY